MKGTYRRLRLNNFLQKTIKIPVIPVKNAWTIVLWWKCESRLAWIWTSKSSSQQQSRCLHNLDCEFNQISEKNLKQDFQLYNCCCSYCAAKKYSNFNLDIQQENLRQGNQLMPLSCNEMLRNEIEYIAKGYQTGLSGKYVKGFEQTPLMFIFCPVEANEWDRKMGAEKTFYLAVIFSCLQCTDILYSGHCWCSRSANKCCFSSLFCSCFAHSCIQSVNPSCIRISVKIVVSTAD